jgi:hypothetical protein
MSLERAIRESLIEGKLPCANAFLVAEREGVASRIVGEEATRLSIRISRCQLGLFGYESTGKKRIVRPEKKLSPPLDRAIRARLRDGRLPCEAAWEIASQKKLSKLDVANAAQTLGIRISACQLGCFD